MRRASNLSCLVFSLVGALLLAGCPAKTDGPEKPADLSASGDLTMMRFDLSVPDLAAAGDMARPVDGAPGDASAPIDLAVGGDMTRPPDMAAPVDLPAPADLPALPDFPASPDLRGADLAGGGDLAAPGDLAGIDLAARPDMACLPTATFTNAQAFASGNNINIQPNVVANAVANQSVTITVWTTPSGANPAVHAIYADNANYNGQKDLRFTYDANPQGAKPPMGTDQWYVVLPPQAAGTHIWLYLRADSCDNKSLYLPGNANYEYLSK